MVNRVKGQLVVKPSMSNPEIVVGNPWEQVMKRVVTQTKRAHQLRQPIAGHVG